LTLIAVEQFFIRVHRRVKVYLIRSGSQAVQRVKEVSFAHRAALQISVYSLGNRESALSQFPLHVSRQTAKQDGVNRLPHRMRPIESQRETSLFIRNPHTSRPVLGAKLERGVENHRMNMQVEMA